MTFFYPLKKLAELDVSEVGFYAKEFSKLERSVSIPFSLVLNYRIFNDFIVHNGLQDLVSENPQTDSERIEFFNNITDAFLDSKFPSHIISDLKECFELVSLDTSNLSSLTDLAREQAVISIRQSTDYEEGAGACPKVLFTKNDFFSFLEFVKRSFISLFCPDAVKYRQNKGIDSFRVGLVISRLPPFQFSFESFNYPDKIIIDSYLGFIDLSGSVVKNRFFLSKDFLKIENRNIDRQETVCVFNIEENKPFIKTYMSNSSSSQIVPDNVVLEVGRLTKRVSSLVSFDEFKLVAVSGKNAQPTILFIENKRPVSENKDELDATDDSGDKTLVDENDNSEVSDSLNNLDLSVENIFESPEIDSLVEAIKNVLKKYHKGSFSSSVDIVLRSLDNEVSFESLNSALNLLKEVLKN